MIMKIYVIQYRKLSLKMSDGCEHKTLLGRVSPSVEMETRNPCQVVFTIRQYSSTFVQTFGREIENIKTLLDRKSMSARERLNFAMKTD